MWYQFFLEQAHFSINLLASLIFFGVCWLYLDAWSGRRNTVGALRWVGFLLLSLSFLIFATEVESTILASPLFNQHILAFLFLITRGAGYIFITSSFFGEAIQKKPTIPNRTLTIIAFPLLSVSSIAEKSIIFLPIGAALCGWLYVRRASIGLENHLKPIALTFFLLAVSELFGLATLFRATTNVDLFKFVAPFGPLWIAQRLAVIAAILMVRSWVFGYLLKRLQTQLFMIFTTATVLIYLATTVSFTSLLVKNIQDEVLGELASNVKVLQYGVESKQRETLSDAQVLAQNAQLIENLDQKNRTELSNIAQSYLLSKKQSTLVVVGDRGQVLARGEDRDRTGDSISDDPLIKRTVVGESPSSVVLRDGIVSPELSVRSAVPVKNGEGQIIGAVMTGTAIDNAFVDGIKKGTGLDSSLYGGNQLSATTLTTADGVTHPIGVAEEHAIIKKTVLEQGEPYSGQVSFLNQLYFGSYLPIKDIDGIPVGMFFVGRPQSSVLAIAGKSIQLTFIATTILLILSVVPAYLIAKNVSEQLE